jgi:hypothetical protein
MDLLESRVLPLDAVDGILNAGQNHVKLDVRNLFFFMPCSLIRLAQGSGQAEDALIAINQPLLCRNPADKHTGKARSRWVKWMQENSIRRKDSNGERHNWGWYKKEFLERQGFVDFDDEKMWIQLETDHVLNSILYIRYGRSNRLIAESDAKGGYHAEGCVRDGKVDRVIGITLPNGSWKTIFNAGDILDEGLEFSSPGRPAAPKTVIVRDLELKENVRLAKCELLTKKHKDAEPESLCCLLPEALSASFPTLYSFSLDDTGMLRCHIGDLPYKTTTKPTDLAKNDGFVLRTALEEETHGYDESLDPFSGVH